MLEKINHIIEHQYLNSCVTFLFSLWAYILSISYHYFDCYDNMSNYTIVTKIIYSYLLYDTAHNGLHMVELYKNETMNASLKWNKITRHIEIMIHHYIFTSLIYLSHIIHYNFYHYLTLEMSTSVLALSRIVQHKSLRKNIKHVFTISWIHNRFIFLPMTLYDHMLSSIPFGIKLYSCISIGILYVMSIKWTTELFLSQQQNRHALNAYSSFILMTIPQSIILCNSQYYNKDMYYSPHHHYALCTLVLCSSLNHIFYPIMNKYYKYIQLADISCINYFSIGCICNFDLFTLLTCNGAVCIIKSYYQQSKLHHLFFSMALVKVIYFQPYVLTFVPVLYYIISYNLMHKYGYKILWHALGSILIYHIIQISSYGIKSISPKIG